MSDIHDDSSRDPSPTQRLPERIEMRCKWCKTLVYGSLADRSEHRMTCDAAQAALEKRRQQKREKEEKSKTKVPDRLKSKTLDAPKCGGFAARNKQTDQAREKLRLYDEEMKRKVEYMKKMEHKAILAAKPKWVRCALCLKRIQEGQLKLHQTTGCIVRSVDWKMQRLEGLCRAAQDEDMKEIIRTACLANVPANVTLTEECLRCLTALEAVVQISDIEQSATDPTSHAISIDKLRPLLPDLHARIDEWKRSISDQALTASVGSIPSSALPRGATPDLPSIGRISHVAVTMSPNSPQNKAQRPPPVSLTPTPNNRVSLMDRSPSPPRHLDEETLALARAVCDGRLKLEDAVMAKDAKSVLGGQQHHHQPFREAINPELRR